MNENLHSFINGETHRNLLHSAAESSINQLFGFRRESQSHSYTRLRLAALLEFKSIIGHEGIEKYLSSKKEGSSWKSCFESWQSYFSVCGLNTETITLTDLLQMSASGLAADRPTDLRNLLSKEFLNSLRAHVEKQKSQQDWLGKLKSTISLSLINLVSQKDRNDLLYSKELISELVKLQKDNENVWLSSSDTKEEDYYVALGFYHIAHATLRLTEFMSQGFVINHEGKSTGFAQELHRIIIKSEEYFSTARSFELTDWSTSAFICLNEIYQNSIWVALKGISSLLDEFIENLASGKNQSQLFSLLPSQRHAVNSSLLDPTKVAVVLEMPTSAGKTLLAEFSIIQTLGAFGKDSRVIYLTPTRALATQVKNTLSADFRHIGVDVLQASSAFEEDEFELSLLESQKGIIVSTPEKADLLLRRKRDWFAETKLIVVDEAHLIGEGHRGVRLELLLANIRREFPEIKLLLLTPFVKNAKTIANWLGGERGVEISVTWRPTNSLIGIVEKRALPREPKKKGRVAVDVIWRAPFSGTVNTDIRSELFESVEKNEVNSSRKMVVQCSKVFSGIGPILAMYPASPSEAEKGAFEYAEKCERIDELKLSPELKFAIALAEEDFGADCKLAECLRKGVAYHHSSLSPELRFLIEDQVRSGNIKYVGATTTLAQGMNFPVSSVIVHSVHKPNGLGDLTSSEFWNIAGRAGRVGLSDKGLILFANDGHKDKWEKYTKALHEPIISALNILASKIDNENFDLKKLYNEHPELRPFFQYFSHSMALLGPQKVKDLTVELVNSSLMYKQIDSISMVKKVRNISERYVDLLSKKNQGYLKLADATGLGTFSFDEIVAKVKNSSILSAGPSSVKAAGKEGLVALIEAFRWVPEFNLSLDNENKGQLNVEVIAEITSGWINGKTIHELANLHPSKKKDIHQKANDVGKYVYSKISQTMAWGAQAYNQAYLLNAETSDKVEPNDNLPSFLQFGVDTSEAALASVLGVPRVLAPSVSKAFNSQYGKLTVDNVSEFKGYVENYDTKKWESIKMHSRLGNKLTTNELITVLKKLQGKI